MDTIKDCPVLFYIYIPVYGMAVITSCFAIFNLLSRWLHNRSWLRKHRHEASAGMAHIFIGCNTQSEKLADDVHKNHPEHRIIFIDLPEEGDKPQGISILDIIARLFRDSKEDDNKILEHLAVGEHLRWEASHLTLGYHPTDGETIDALKLHNCIRSYNELNYTKQHFAWLVVKNSL